MTRLSPEAKQAIIAKALTANGHGIRELATLHNVGYSTLYQWVKGCRAGKLRTHSGTAAGQHTQAERFEHLMATSMLDEAAVGAYCRERGLFSHQLTLWKKEFMSQNKEQKNNSEHSELKALRLENKLLKHDLRRKDKALAETAALLILKKKATLLWGDHEDV